LVLEKEFLVSSKDILEYITKYSYRCKWVIGVDDFNFNENEVTRLGSENVCFINGKHLGFLVVVKEVEYGALIYGEMSKDPIVVDKLNQFYTISSLTSTLCLLSLETYFEPKSIIKKTLIYFIVKRVFKKNTKKGLANLFDFIKTKNNL
jgi:paraquat-inducible protein B